MKKCYTAFVLAALFAQIQPIRAFDPKHEDYSLDIELEVIEVSRADFLKLVYGKMLLRDSTELRETVQKLILADEAQHRAHSLIRTRSGQRAKVESTVSVRLDEKRDRNVGLTMEIDPVINNDGVSVSLNLAPEIVDVEMVGGPYLEGGDQVKTIGPFFHTQRLSTAVFCPAGAYILAGSTELPNSQDPKSERINLWFVRSHLNL